MYMLYMSPSLFFMSYKGKPVYGSMSPLSTNSNYTRDFSLKFSAKYLGIPPETMTLGVSFLSTKAEDFLSASRGLCLKGKVYLVT